VNARLEVNPNRISPANLGRVLIVRMSAMGDILHAMPAVAALREAFPNATIGWLVEERWAELLSLPRSAGAAGRSSAAKLADQIHIVNTKKWRTALLSSSTRHEIAAVVRDLRRMNYEVAIDFQGLIRSSVLAKLSGAKMIFGFAHPREPAARFLYTQRITPRGSHVVEKNLSLASAVAGSDLTGAAVDFPAAEITEKDCDRWLEEHRIHRFVLLNPGAGWTSKQWPAERYGQLAKSLGELGFKSLINVGPGEQDLARAVQTASEGTAEAIECSIPQLVAFTRRASLFVGGDTGPMHLAAALRIPVVAIFGPTDPVRNGPYGTDSIPLRSPSNRLHRNRAKLDPGLLTIGPEQVLAACQKLLGGAHAG
jgi:heptosyltransferase-1